MKINFHYEMKYERVDTFEWKRYNHIVSLETYKDQIMPKLSSVIDNLHKRPDSRQEAIIVNREKLDNSCLLSMQFQLLNNTLIVISNYRSQCKVHGRPVDTIMNRYVATKIIDGLESLGNKIKSCKIYVNVGNYHLNRSECNLDCDAMPLYKMLKQI